jgi:hypothetical protein
MTNPNNLPPSPWTDSAPAPTTASPTRVIIDKIDISFGDVFTLVAQVWGASLLFAVGLAILYYLVVHAVVR